MASNPFRFLQRHRTRLLLTCALVLTVCIAAGPLPRRNAADFTLQARVLEALENGPVVIEATGGYQGKEPLEIFSMAGDDGFYVDWQLKWRPDEALRPFSHAGCPYGQQTLLPGKPRTAVKFVHQDYSAIPPGRVTLHVRWSVYEPGKFGKETPHLEQLLEDPRRVFREGFRKLGPMNFAFGKLIANLETTVLVDVHPATPANLAALRNRFEKELDRPDITQERVKYITECVTHTPHKELVSVALKLFDYPDVHCWPLIQKIHQSHPDPREANEFLLRYAIHPDSLRPLIPFHHNQWDEKSFNDAQIQSLRSAKNPWVRLATLATFPKQCPAKWKADLLAELGNLPELPAAVDEVRKLDHANFQAREEATRRLQNLRELAEPAVRAHLQGNISLESRRRCEQILEEWQRHPKDLNLSSALGVLEDAPGPEGKEILEILAKAPADCRLAKAAQTALQRLKR